MANIRSTPHRFDVNATVARNIQDTNPFGGKATPWNCARLPNKPETNSKQECIPFQYNAYHNLHNRHLPKRTIPWLINSQKHTHTSTQYPNQGMTYGAPNVVPMKSHKILCCFHVIPMSSHEISAPKTFPFKEHSYYTALLKSLLLTLLCDFIKAFNICGN